MTPSCWEGTEKLGPGPEGRQMGVVSHGGRSRVGPTLLQLIHPPPAPARRDLIPSRGPHTTAAEGPARGVLGTSSPNPHNTWVWWV